MSSASFLSQIRKGHSSGTSRLLKELANKYQKLASANVVIQDENLTDEGLTLRNRMLMRDKVRYIKQTTTIPDFQVPFEPDGSILTLWLRGNHTGLFLKDLSKSTPTSSPRVIGVYNNKQICVVDSGGLDVGYLGTYNGVESSPCWKLNGIDEGAGVLDSTDLQVKATTTGISLTAWVKVTDFSQYLGLNRRIMSKTDDANNSYCLFVGNNNSACFAVKFAGVEYKVTSPATLTTDTWYFIAATFNSAGTPAAKIYVNGTVSTTSLGTTISYISTADTNLNLFCNSGDADELFGPFAGYVRDIRLYREKVLTQQEVTNFNTNRNTISNIPFGSVPMAGYWFAPGSMTLSSFTSTSFTNTSFNL